MGTTTKKSGRRWVNSTKVSYDGINFDSTLELYMYKLLKEAGIPFSYVGRERGKYTLVEGFEYAQCCYETKGKINKDLVDVDKVLSIGYTPDIMCPNETFFIEVKGRELESFTLRWKLFKKEMMKRDSPPLLFMPKNKKNCEQTILILKELGYGIK